MNQISKSDLITYVSGGRIAPELRHQISLESERPDSEVRDWLHEFYAKCQSPFDVDWLQLFLDDFMPQAEAETEASISPEEMEQALQVEARAFDLINQGEYEAAHAFAAEDLQRVDSELGKDHPVRVFGLNTLANVFINVGVYEAAITLLVEAIRLCKLSEDGAPVEAKIRVTLSTCYSQCAEFGSARSELSTAQELLTAAEHGLDESTRDEVKGFLHETSLKLAMAELLVNVMQGNYELAESMGWQLYTDLAETGEDTVEKAEAANLLSQALRGTGNQEDAVRAAGAAFMTASRIYGQHPKVSLYLANLAACHIDAGDLEKAEDYLKPVVHQIVDSQTMTYFSAAVLINLGSVFLQTGRLKEAEDCFQGAQNVFDQIGGERTLGYAVLQFNLASLAARTDR